MISYVTLGTNNLPRATAFYGELLTELGGKRMMDLSRGCAWGTKANRPMLGIITPYDKRPATIGNSVMVALAVNSKETVDRVYRKALELGGTDEGPAGPRGDGFYAVYFRDLDGNKLNVFCLG